jgi:hypothetical protein
MTARALGIGKSAVPPGAAGRSGVKRNLTDDNLADMMEDEDSERTP